LSETPGNVGHHQVIKLTEEFYVNGNIEREKVTYHNIVIVKIFKMSISNSKCQMPTSFL